VIALKTLLFTVIVPGTVTVLVPYWILSSADEWNAAWPAALRLAALAPILAGVCIYARCAFDFVSAGRGTPAPIDPPTELVVRGLYRFTRNPMYVGVLTLLVGEALWFGSARLLLYAAGMFAVFHVFIVAYEEPGLRRRFGDAYGRYCARVPRWLGRPGDAAR
jgi:protein-S-isoprenylcysteine O-methyltransferase Ste14